MALATLCGIEASRTDRAGSGKSSVVSLPPEPPPTEAETDHYLRLAGVTTSQLVSDRLEPEEAIHRESVARDYIKANIGLLRMFEQKAVSAGASRQSAGKFDRSPKQFRAQFAALINGIHEAAVPQRSAEVPGLAMDGSSLPGLDVPPAGGTPSQADPISGPDFAERGFRGPP